MNLNHQSIISKVSGLALLGLLSTSNAFAATPNSGGDLKSDDLVGISFWIISMALVAATAFFFLETQRVTPKWKTSLTVSGLVTMVAATHYFYMRSVWVETGNTPTVFRYIDWLITVPLLMVEFYLILSAITKVPAGVFWRLMIGTIVMLVGGYLGEAGYGHLACIHHRNGRLGIYPMGNLSRRGWENQCEVGTSSSAVCFQRHALDCSGWLGDLSDWIFPRLSHWSESRRKHGTLNVVYNFADVVNKIAFGVIIWVAATSESDKVLGSSKA